MEGTPPSSEREQITLLKLKFLYSRGLKSLLHQFILRLYFPFSLLWVILYFLLVLNHHQSRLDVGIFNR